MLSTSLTSELDAVNTLLDAIGEAPVSTIENSGLADVALARSLLSEVSREVQSRGWHWNLDPNVPLAPEYPLPGIIRVPITALRVDPADPNVDAVVRGGKLWNRRELTFAWSDTVRCHVMQLLPFTDIPQSARSYICIRAARDFQKRRLGSSSLEVADETRALVALQDEEAEVGDYNLSNSSPVKGALNWASPFGNGAHSLTRS